MRIEQITADKKHFADLLLQADPCMETVDRYLETGEMYVLFDSDEPVCECVLWERNSREIELKNLATQPHRRRQGHASHLLREMFHLCAGLYAKMYVNTCGAETFYESPGSRYGYTDAGFFTRNYPEPVIDNGVQCIDMVYLVREL